MSEKESIYTKVGIPTTREAFLNRPCTRQAITGLYVPPTPEEVKALRVLAGWTQVDVAKIVNVSYNDTKGSNTVRKWETAKGEKEHRPIRYETWRGLLLRANIVDVF